MRYVVNQACVGVIFLVLWTAAPILAEDQSQSGKQEPKKARSEQSQQAKKNISPKPVPFAQYEQAFKNSERWKSLTPEEQKEALEKIAQYRERFRQKELERQKKYLPLLNRPPRKRKRPSREEYFEEHPDKPLESGR